MKAKFLVLGASLMLVLCGCKSKEFVPDNSSSGDNNQQQPTTVSVESVSLNHETATLEVGQTVQLTATVLPENATNKAVNWSATGEGVVTVDEGLVTALATGTSVVTATSVDGSKTDSCTVTVSDPYAKPAGAVDLEYATAETLGTHGDNWCYFNDPEWWSGASAEVNAAFTYDDKVVYDYTYQPTSNPGGNNWSVQLMKKNSALTVNSWYELSFNIRSNKAGVIIVNDVQKSIVAGTNTISVIYKETAAASITIQFSYSLIGSAKVILSNVVWEETVAAPEGVVVNETAGVYTIAFAAVAGADSYKAYYVDYAAGTDVDNEVVTNGGTLTKVASLADGKYKVFVTAVKGQKESARSTSFGVIQKGEAAPVVPAGGPKTNMIFGEEHEGGSGPFALPDDRFVYWNDQWWCGSNVTVAAGDAYTEEGLVHIEYTAEGSCNFGLQVFYKNTSLTVGTEYTLSFKMKVSVAGEYFARSSDAIDALNLEADTWTNVSYDYTEVADATSFKVCVPAQRAAHNVIELKDFAWNAK